MFASLSQFTSIFREQHQLSESVTVSWTARLRTLFQIVMLAAAYFVAAVVGLEFAIPPGNASAVWPPSGLAVGVLLLTSWRYIPGIWIGAWSVTLLTGGSLLTATVIATGNSLAALAALQLCKKFIDLESPFKTVKAAFLWIGLSAASCSIAATCGVTWLYLSSVLEPADVYTNWSTWWLGDLSGLMLVTPPILVIRNRIKSGNFTGSISERILAFILLALISQCIFGGWLLEQKAISLLYLPVVIQICLLLRFGTASVFIGNLVITVLAVLGTSQGAGAFGTEAVGQSLFDLQSFLIIYATTGMVLCGLLQSKHDSQREHHKMSIEIETTKGKMQLAHDIQAGLFPSEPIQNQHAQCVGSCQAAEDASGDYFDFVEESDDKIVMMIGDVSGHGVGPALLMAETRAYVRALLHKERHLVTILQLLNQFLVEDLDDGHFVTFMICRFDAGSGTIEYVGAGHEGLVIHNHGKSTKLESSTIPVGMCQTMPGCIAKSMHVHSNEIIALYTDGLVESRSITGEMFGYERLKKSFHKHRHLPSAALIEQVFEDVDAFCGATPLRDDRTLVVLKLK